MEEEQDLPEQPVSISFKFKVIVEKLIWRDFSSIIQLYLQNPS